jgi:signal transduction histidine kinase
VIGAAVLAIGLLLILAAFASAWIPGGATFARSAIGDSGTTADLGAGNLFAFARRARNPIRAFALSPIHPATWYANTAIVLGFFIAVFASATIFSIASAGLTVLLAGVGLILIALAIEGSRLVARIERWRAFIGEPSRPPAHLYKPLRGGALAILRAEFADESRWRDVIYVAVNLPLATIEFFVVGVLWVLSLSLLTMPLWYDATPGASLPGLLGPISGHDPLVVLLRTGFGLALLPVAASLSQLVIALHRGVVAGLLCTSESRELRRQVETLRESRSAVLDVEASELNRIERDLHDGAQQRLVMLTIDLGLASERIDTDPAAAKQLLVDGQEQARQALAEIRDLVRGIAPAILVDRGLVPALASISGRGPVPAALLSDLAPGERLPAATERAAYFVVTEALANVAKHSGAARCEVRVRLEGSRLIVEVWDDGHGGARVEPGGGLAGLASRIAGVDGTFSVSSPVGGPTLVRAEIPVAGGAAAGTSGAAAGPTATGPTAPGPTAPGR